MSLTERETKVYHDILEWQNQLYQYEANDFELTFDKYVERAFKSLPENIQEQCFSLLDNWLFHLQALIQSSQIQLDAKERILASGRIFDPDITQIEDMRNLSIDQLQYIAGQQISRHRFYSLIQGGLSGTGGKLTLSTDIPAMAVINLRVVQLIALVYGYNVNIPYEMMTSLKVFHGATLPIRMQSSAWPELFADLRNRETSYFYEGEEEITDITWMEQPIKHIFKAMVISLFKRKTVKGIPVIGIGIGAGTNYTLTRKVTDFAQKYYQMRYLLEKTGGYHEHT